MRAAILFLCTAAIVGTARAEVPISLGVQAGVIAGVGPLRYAPALALDAGVGMPGGLFRLIGRVDGWTLNQTGTAVANSEVTASVGAQYSHEIVSTLYWSGGVAGAVTFLNRAGAALEYRPGVLLTPALEITTRRRSLGLKLGGTALLSTEGVRLGATLGAVYTFD